MVLRSGLLLRILETGAISVFREKISLAETASRTALENALFLYAPQDRQQAARIFLEALAVDELLFLAGFLGSCILASSTFRVDIRQAIRHRANTMRNRRDKIGPRQREDLGHKLILVGEFVSRCALGAGCR